MRPKTIRGWNIDEGAVAGHWASLTLALLGCFFFSGVTSESLAHIKQTAAGFTWKPPEANALTPGLIGMFLPPQMSPPKKEEAPSWFSHCKSGWAESACCTFSSSFPPPISSRSLFFFFSHPLCLFFLSPSSGSVPTVPPGNVQAEPVNSTTVRFTWSAPSPQFINGINQGYKVSPAPFCQLVHSSGRRQTSTQSVQISFRLQQWWDVFLSGV